MKENIEVSDDWSAKALQIFETLHTFRRNLNRCDFAGEDVDLVDQL